MRSQSRLGGVSSVGGSVACFTGVMGYYMHDGLAAFRFELAGDVDATDAARLEQDWHTASSTLGTRTLIVDMSFVTGLDAAARSLFRRWHDAGAEFAAGSPRSRELVESITGRPFIAGALQPRTYESWFSRKSIPRIMLAVFGLALSSTLYSAELKPETQRLGAVCSIGGCRHAVAASPDETQRIHTSVNVTVAGRQHGDVSRNAPAQQRRQST